MKMRGLMRWLFLCAVLAAACDATTTTASDFGVELPGCRGPSQCWNLRCPCIFASISDCLLCDPKNDPNGVCVCSSFDQDGMIEVSCIEGAQVCVGRAPTTCNGLCVRAGQSCMTGGDPPDEVASVTAGDGGPGVERRCPYSDDICCD
jgi:hypothetical protein